MKKIENVNVCWVDLYNVINMDISNEELPMLGNNDSFEHQFINIDKKALPILKENGSLILECSFENFRDNKNYEMMLILRTVSKRYDNMVTYEFKLQAIRLYTKLDKLIDINIYDTLRIDATTKLQECHYHLLFILYVKCNFGHGVNGRSCAKCHIIGSYVKHNVQNKYVCKCCGFITMICDDTTSSFEGDTDMLLDFYDASSNDHGFDSSDDGW